MPTQPAMTKRIYFDYDDRDRLSRWLASRPTGAWQVLIGGHSSDNIANEIVAGVISAQPGLAEWVMEKLQQGELVVRVSPEPLDIPSGVHLESSIPNDS